MAKEQHAPFLETNMETGFFGGGRLHGSFFKIEPMVPGECKNGGESLSINYDFKTTIFGKVLIATTHRGVCQVSFVKNEDDGVRELCVNFPKANFANQRDGLQEKALNFFEHLETQEKIILHVKGTPFQIKVWEALLQIPNGTVASYGDISTIIKNPKAYRAVGSAIGSNPVAFLIPCHRVIRSTGLFGSYKWGSDMKTAIISFETFKGKNPTS